MIALVLIISAVWSAWTLVGLAVGLILGPVLRDRSAAYPPIDEAA